MSPVFEKTLAAFVDAISSPALKGVAQYWGEACRDGELASWKDLQPAAIKKYLPIVWSYDYDAANDDFIGRLAGAKITSLSAGPFKGVRLSEIRPSDRYPRSLLRARRVINEPALYRGHGLVYQSTESIGVGERIVMPLGRDQNYPGGIFGASEFQSTANWQNLSLNLNGEDELWFSLEGAGPGD
jgi:hypothetical protein